MKARIAVIDHGAGNLVSVRSGLERAGAVVVMAADPEDLDEIDGIVLPGVGSAPQAMRRLQERRLDEALASWQGPLLGICLGMQVLFERSEEFGGSSNLGLLPGRVEPLSDAPRSIHMGWNDVAHSGEGLFAGIDDNEPFYFVHSFVAVPASIDLVTGVAAYENHFAAAVAMDVITGVQFHPERSSTAGLKLLSNFVDQVCRAA